MILQVLHCPHCHGTDIVRHGTTRQGKQRYRCRACRQGRGRTFLLDYAYAGQSPEVKQQIVDMAMNARKREKGDGFIFHNDVPAGRFGMRGRSICAYGVTQI